MEALVIKNKKKSVRGLESGRLIFIDTAKRGFVILVVTSNPPLCQEK